MRQLSFPILAATLALGAAHAHAGDETAEAAFARGQAAMKAGRVHEACQAFEASDQLQAKVETKWELAKCYEEDGRPVTAARIYRALADQDTNADRRKKSADKVEKLEAKAAKLRILPSQRPDGLVIKVDGVVVANAGTVLVDIGPHEIVASAPGFAGHASAAIDRERQVADVILRLEAKPEMMTSEPKAEPKPEAKPEAKPMESEANESAMAAPMPAMHDTSAGGDHRKRNAVIVGAVGAGVLVTGVVFLAAASSKFGDEHALCPGATCATQEDLDRAHSLLSDGRTYRGIGIGMGIGGLAVIGVGAYLFFTAHDESSHLALDVGHERAGLAFTGRF